MSNSKHHRPQSRLRHAGAFIAAALVTLGLWSAAHASPPPSAAASSPPAALSSPLHDGHDSDEKTAPLSGALNLNTATEEELVRLPGVGASKAALIVAWRKKHGQFAHVDDLGRVKGFGRKTLAKLKPNLSVSGPTTLAGAKGNHKGPSRHDD